ncbi:hypothetical protein [Ornithinibacillus halophilus]|uniref:hypothetical protein n=1 Tax=Ornithinibacillus halophilus TaxID=930117 RepID=UPI00093467A6|nr:hypothetical protein [Ornithinibacillus halophilus]
MGFLIILSLELENPDWESTIDQLENEDAIRITPIINGEEISEEELTEVYDSIQWKVDKNVNFRMEQDGNSILLFPEYHHFMWFTSTGEIGLHLEMEGKYPNEFAEIDFQVMIHDLPFWKKWGPPLLIILLVLLALIYIIEVIKNPRFKKGSYISVDKRMIQSG